MRLLSEIRNYMGNYHVKSGVYHYYRNEFKQAIGFLRKALSEEPELLEGDRTHARSYLTLAHKGLAERLASESQGNEAIEEVRQALLVSPDYPDIHYLLARLLEREDRLEEAVTAYRAAIERHPRYLEARTALAYCLLAQGAHGAAAQAFEQAFAEKWARVEEPFRQGLEELRAGQADAALETLHAVFRGAPMLAEELLRKAGDAYRNKDYTRSLEALNQAIDLHPHYPDLHNFRGIVLCELERFDEAILSFSRSAALSPGHTVPRLNLAFAQLRAGRPLEAEEALRSLLQEVPTEPVALAKIEELRGARQSGLRSTGA